MRSVLKFTSPLIDAMSLVRDHEEDTVTQSRFFKEYCELAVARTNLGGCQEYPVAFLFHILWVP